MTIQNLKKIFPLSSSFRQNTRVLHETNNAEFNSVNDDIILPDTRKGHENNKADTMPTGCSAQRPIMTKGNETFSPSDNDTSSLSFPCLTRESRSHECRIESGRSMVEMLGVLAVIGMLSIGGIMGYSYGMDKYRANTTINDINLRRIDLMAQEENGNNNPTLDAWNNEKTLYPIALVFDADSGTPLIQVSNVPEQVCEMIVKDMEKQAAITVNSYYTVGQEDGGCEEKNDLTFYFGDYTVCGTDYCSGDKPACNLDTQTCVECLDSGDCPSETPICNTSNMCEACPTDKPFYDASTGVCGNCQKDADYPNNGWCLYNKSMPVNADLPHTLNSCVIPTYKDVLSAEDSPDGKKWIYATISGYGSMWNGPVICSKFGMIFPYPEDFIVGCVNPKTSCSGAKTETAIAIQNADTKRHIRVQGVDPTDPNKGFILDLQSSDTQALGYYYRGIVSLGIYCRSE
ncbi:MAG: hypothetical protein IKY98_00260 [Alphaproteobacteria bacterium]|nr:hypothetical protein [Alphaproteobacteria bacterium]